MGVLVDGVAEAIEILEIVAEQIIPQFLSLFRNKEQGRVLDLELFLGYTDQLREAC